MSRSTLDEARNIDGGRTDRNSGALAGGTLLAFHLSRVCKRWRHTNLSWKWTGANEPALRLYRRFAKVGETGYYPKGAAKGGNGASYCGDVVKFSFTSVKRRYPVDHGPASADPGRFAHLCGLFWSVACCNLLPPGFVVCGRPLQSPFCRLAYRVLGVRASVSSPASGEQPALLVSIMFRGPTWSRFRLHLRQICFLARHDVADWPGLGLLALSVRHTFVERGKIGKSAVNHAMAEHAERAWFSFPETTTGDGTRMNLVSTQCHLAARRDLLRCGRTSARSPVAPAAISHRQGAAGAWNAPAWQPIMAIQNLRRILIRITEFRRRRRMRIPSCRQWNSGRQRPKSRRPAPRAAIRCEIANPVGENRSRAATV